MITRRTGLLAGATICTALVIGLLMQQTADRQALRAEQVSVPAYDPTVQSDQPLKIEAISLTAAPIDAEDQSAAATRVDPTAGCDMTVEAIARPFAEVRLTILSLCRPDERLTIHHNGMVFSSNLDAAGALTVQVPALAETAVFIIEPQNGRGSVATVTVPDLNSVNRVALQWAGNSGFELHAREFGASYGGAGHVWHGSDLSAGRGTVVQLGNAAQLAPRLAEVYSIPRDGGQAGSVDLTVETEVTAINCGRDVSAQTLELRDGQLRTRDLTLTMPECSATGDFLVLNNLLETLKIAGN
ncbi:hypothetical protein [Phaeobacter sp.]|uniref:hypothetical protein n=1 Tax=Phaeobacter sp. TaxID=1902409 RepID=UPI0025E02FFB|nr:hypothetical protein [Phaeobacter sp.]